MRVHNKILEKTSEREHQKLFKLNEQSNVGETGSTTEKINQILEILKDGQWHMLNEVQSKAKLNETQLKEITSFLKEYEFIIWNETKKELKLDESVRRFLT